MAPVPAPQKSGDPKAVAAFVALIGLDEKSARLLRDSFKQFGIETAAFDLEAAPPRFKKEKFEGVVLDLSSEDAGKLLINIRGSANTQRMVVYGICATAQEALRYSHYGVNAIFNVPLDRQNTIRVIRATHLLVLHELRRYVRIPIVTDVSFRADGISRHGTMIEISGGGLSMETNAKLSLGETVEVTFKLPKTRRDVSLRAQVAWVRPDHGTAGVRYEPMDPCRVDVKNWIDDYLGIE